jgi:beta-glucosidase
MDNAIAQNGDWSLGSGQDFRGEQPRNFTTVVLDALVARFEKAKIESDRTVNWERPGTNFAEILDLARSVDIVIAVVGDIPKYIGEYKSTATLELQGPQKDLLKELAELSTPLIIDIISSKPLVLPKSAIAHASAIIQQFSPGMLGGAAFARVLAGDVNPSGKLPISIPYHVGQLPVYYNTVRGAHASGYVDTRTGARWSFGYGLSYSIFQYLNATINGNLFGKEDDIVVVVRIQNNSPRTGIETVQLYVADLITSATWPEHELKAYKRVEIKGNSVVDVELKIKASDCSIVNAGGERVVEPGKFMFRVGPSSSNLAFELPATIA